MILSDRLSSVKQDSCKLSPITRGNGCLCVCLCFNHRSFHLSRWHFICSFIMVITTHTQFSCVFPNWGNIFYLSIYFYFRWCGRLVIGSAVPSMCAITWMYGEWSGLKLSIWSAITLLRKFSLALIRCATSSKKMHQKEHNDRCVRMWLFIFILPGKYI